MSETQIYINGTFYPKSEAKISVFDHGLLYGDGVFEGIRSYHGQVFLCREHIDRLYEGAHCLRITIPYTKNEMRDILYDCLKKNGVTDAYFRLVITRGIGDLGLSPSKCADKGTVICICASISLYPESLYQEGLSIITTAVPRSHPETLNPRVKSLNYLPNIMANIEASNAKAGEAVMLNHRGEVSECTGDNIFIVKNGVLKTPPPSAVLLEGCTRNQVLRLAKEAGIPAEQPTLARYDLYTADECFLTGTAAELIPAVSIDGRAIGTGKPGPMTADMLKRFRAFAASYRDEAKW
jgi:branched-chain amino acid aminotransferase